MSGVIFGPDEHRRLHEEVRACRWHRRYETWCWCHWRDLLERYHAEHGCEQDTA